MGRARLPHLDGAKLGLAVPGTIEGLPDHGGSHWEAGPGLRHGHWGVDRQETGVRGRGCGGGVGVYRAWTMRIVLAVNSTCQCTWLPKPVCLHIPRLHHALTKNIFNFFF